MTAVRWMLYDQVKVLFSDKQVQITYGAKTKRNRLNLNLEKSHINDAYAMGEFHPKHRTEPIYLKKKRRNNRCLEKFYDAKYIDSRDGKVKSGQQLSNSRINRNHKKDSKTICRWVHLCITKERSARKDAIPLLIKIRSSLAKYSMEIKLKAFRVNAGLSVYDMADLLKVSKSTVSRWENGDNRIPIAQFEKYCEICHIDQETKTLLSTKNVKTKGGKTDERKF